MESLSLPVRERGLKSAGLGEPVAAGGVAPRAGAWIVIVFCRLTSFVIFGREPGRCEEIYNDYNGNLVTLFWCVKNRPLALMTELNFLPLNSRQEFEVLRKLLREVVLFDVYEGKNLPAGKKSYAVSFFLQDEGKTLTDKQIDAIMKKIQTNLEQKLGAQLR